MDKFVKKQRCSRGFLFHPDPADTRWTHRPVLPMYVCYRCLIKRPNVVFRLQRVVTPRLIRSLEVILPRSITGSGIWNLAGEPPAKTKDLDSHAFDFKHIIYSFHLICLSVAAHSRLSIPPCHAIWQVSPGDERRGDNGLTTENWGARDANKILKKDIFNRCLIENEPPRPYLEIKENFYWKWNREGTNKQTRNGFLFQSYLSF